MVPGRERPALHSSSMALDILGPWLHNFLSRSHAQSGSRWPRHRSTNIIKYLQSRCRCLIFSEIDSAWLSSFCEKQNDLISSAYCAVSKIGIWSTRSPELQGGFARIWSVLGWEYLSPNILVVRLPLFRGCLPSGFEERHGAASSWPGVARTSIVAWSWGFEDIGWLGSVFMWFEKTWWMASWLGLGLVCA